MCFEDIERVIDDWNSLLQRANTYCPTLPTWAQGLNVSHIFRANHLSPQEAIVQAVGPNTLRAFRNNAHYAPQSIFRRWARTRFDENGEPTEMFTNTAQDGFAALRVWCLQSLCEFWNQCESGLENFEFAHQNKLIDLFLKQLPRLAILPNGIRKEIYCNTHVPLDSYTLRAVRTLWNHDNPAEDEIPRNASMNWVTNQDRYDKMQEFLRNVMQRAGAKAIEFDVLAWHAGRTDEDQFLLKPVG